MNKKQTGILLITTLVLMATIVVAMGLSLVGSDFAPRYKELYLGPDGWTETYYGLEGVVRVPDGNMKLNEVIPLIIFAIGFVSFLSYMIWREINAQHSNS